MSVIDASPKPIVHHRSDRPHLGMVIPCFNEQDVIPELLRELDTFIASCGLPCSVLFVDDGSRDRTRALLEQACSQSPAYALLSLSRNFGHQTAVSAGLRFIRGDVVAVLDADLQDPPPVVLDMIKRWRDGYDVIYGIRTNRKEGWLLRAAYALFYRLLKRMANVDIPLDAGDFSLMDRKVVDYINRMPEHNRFVRGLRGWVGFRQTGLPYERAARQSGAAKYNFRRLMQLAIDGFVSFSIVPLRLATWVGVLTSAFGFLLALWALGSALLTEKVPPGWASLAVMLLFFAGIQLIVLGIIGEYVGRIFEEVKNRPHFLVAHAAGWVKPNAGESV